ncbi:MAG: DNA-directed RNA polymerase subunit omega [Acutalibacter sp.]|jgi:DNA-directed RNA polymerase subunit omega|nr:DNA-directed RNA polymerase subunit omega [Acutalibacter sp.]NBJ88041.1 DNA-directed RNA polymerase subunit omega [Acutalibacter sp. 1XD8-36]
MLKPSANIIRTPHMNQYSLVIAVAKRARQISERAEDEGVKLIDKPVDMAVQDFVHERYRIIEPENIEEG